MRLLLALLVLAASMLAQESEDPKHPDPKNLEEQGKLLHEFLKKWEQKLDKKQRIEIEGELKKLSPKALEFLIEIAPGVHVRKHFGIADGAFRILLERAPSEVITGTWEEEGKKGSYALKSLGEGHYELQATIKDTDGKKTEFKDSGKLAELRKQHKFLLETVMFGMPRGPGAGAYEFRPHKPELGEVGLLVHPASPELRHHLAIAQGAGMVVGAVIPGSRAEKLGLQKYDILVKLGGELVDAPHQLKKLNAKTGTLEYIRRGKTRTLDLAKPAESESKR